MYYAEKKDYWILLKDNVDAKYLSTKLVGGFVGCLYGLYGTFSGEPTQSVARFNWFTYKGDDAVYK